jgi:hypothetical protein
LNQWSLWKYPLVNLFDAVWINLCDGPLFYFLNERGRGGGFESGPALILNQTPISQISLKYKGQYDIRKNFTTPVGCDIRGKGNSGTQRFWMKAVITAKRKIGMFEIKTWCLVFCLLLPSTGRAVDLTFDEKDFGKLVGQVKGMSVLHGLDNGYDPETGSAYLLKLKYITPRFRGISAAATGYLTGDLFGLTDWDKKVARGMFVDDQGDDTAQLGEIYARYDSAGGQAFGGRMGLDTPMTKNAYSTIPNLYTAVGMAGRPIEGLTLGLGHIFEMSFGARAMTDFGLIGEATGTAGATVKPNTIGQAKFHRISTVTLGEDAPRTEGITTFMASYAGLKKATLRLWDYYAYDIANTIYVDADGAIPVSSRLKLDLGGQFLYQNDVGDSLLGSLDFFLFGIKAGIVGANWSMHGIFNNSAGDTGLANPWGGDPAYTSTTFSRNAYRKDVNAWGVRGKYEIIKGLTFTAEYVDYGKSDTVGSVSSVGEGLTAIDDAIEWDLALVWKPPQVKGLMIRTFYANRTSEYNGSNNKELKQSHWRVIVAYDF